ncbi:MAG: NlpC/P60 family protein [Bacteroidetes bacterium]|nr:MAG: NlpC/P60 family protein [Bacteroidota bacterium]
MDGKGKITVCIFSLALVIAGCQPSVRFTSSKKPNNNSTYSKPVKTEQKGETFKYSPETIGAERYRIIEEAESWLGTPYCYGGYSKDCTDCSGFVLNIFQAVGIMLPRTAETQFEYGNNIDDNDKEAGDLVFFRDKSKISHVGIYAGNNEFIHASISNGVVRQSLDDFYYREHYAGAKRVIQ